MHLQGVEQHLQRTIRIARQGLGHQHALQVINTDRGRLSALSEAQSQLLPVQFDLMKVSKEKDLLSSRLTELESEMEKINKDFMDYRRELSNQISDLMMEKVTANAEMEEMQGRYKAAQVIIMYRGL